MRLTGEIEPLKERQLTDGEAKAMIHDVFMQGILPIRLLPRVSRTYFNLPFSDLAGVFLLVAPQRLYACRQVEAYRRCGGGIPANLCIRYSAHLVDGPPPLQSASR